MPASNHYFFTLADKRKLSYALYGPANGKPVLYFHGTPSSRLEPLLLNAYNKGLEQLLHEYNIQLIAVDRPGMGLSTYDVGKTFYSFANDVAQLTTHLQIVNLGVLGWSGAGPYALSLAYHFPQLINGVYLLAAFTRSLGEGHVFKALNTNKYYFGTARYAPWLLRSVLKTVTEKPTDKPLPKWLSGLHEVDNRCINTPEKIQHFSTVTVCEACITGSKGAVQEAAIYFNPTSYNIEKIQQPIHYWWGTADNVIPLLHSTAIAEKAPNATMHYKQGEGHISIYIQCFKEVLETIAKQ